MYNILAEGMNDTERSALLAHLIKIKPGLVVVIDRLSYALAIKQALPQTAVVFRRYHPSNAGGDDNVHLKLTPQQWLESYGDVPKSAGLYLYSNNEPGISPETFAHAEQCARLAVNAGYKICALNFSVGVPEPEDWELPESLALLRFAGANRNRVLICVHEYAPSFSGFEFGLPPDPAHWPDMVGGASWLLSRYRNIFKACDKHGITRPRIGITEASFDGIDAAKAYQNSLPHTNGLIGALWANIEAWQRMKPDRFSWPQYMVEQLHWMYRAIFRTDPEVVGVANFCMGSFEGTRWRLYDLLRVPNIFQLMEAKDWQPMTTPTPTPTVTPNAWVNASGSGGTNIRATASTTAAIKRTLTDKGELAKRGRSQPVADYIWHEYTFLNGVTGWARADVHRWVELMPSEETLDVPYYSQNDADSNLWPNDCGPAALAAMMAYAGRKYTVNDVARRAGMVGSEFSSFQQLITAAKSYGFDAVHKRPFLLSDIIASLIDGYPVLSLVNYAQLKSGKNYGHFITVVGYALTGQSLEVVIHDPNDRSYARYPAAQFAKAIAYEGSTANMPFQSLIFTNWKDFEKPTEPPPPSGDESPALIRLAAIGREIAAHAGAIETLTTEQATLLSTIKG